MSEPLVADAVLDKHPELRKKLRPEDEFVLETMRRQREHTRREAERIAAVGELNNRAIFLAGGGRVPPELRTEVQAVLMPSAPPIEEPTNGESEDGG